MDQISQLLNVIRQYPLADPSDGIEGKEMSESIMQELENKMRTIGASRNVDVSVYQPFPLLWSFDRHIDWG